MSGPAELLLLRLGLIAIIFVFVMGAAAALRGGVSPRLARGEVRRAGTREPRLVVVAPADTGLLVGTEIVLNGPMTIGRDVANGIVLADASVSGRHAIIEETARGWVLRDLGSTNGTFVANRRADGRSMGVREGEVVAFGAVGFRFKT